VAITASIDGVYEVTAEADSVQLLPCPAFRCQRHRSKCEASFDACGKKILVIVPLIVGTSGAVSVVSSIIR